MPLQSARLQFAAGGAALLEVSMHLRTGCLRLSPGAGLGKSGVDAMAGIRKVGGMVFPFAQMDEAQESLRCARLLTLFLPAHAAGHVAAPTTIGRWQQ